jgi:hypothetical protein
MQTAKLTASDGAAADGMTFSGDQLGSSVAIDGDTIVAGAPLDTVGTNATQGSVYTFTRTGGPGRTEIAKLTASDGAAGDQLGSSVAIDGDTIVAGALLDNVGLNADQGSAYTFARTGAAARTETAKLTATDGAASDRLGSSVAVDGDTIVAGAPFDATGTTTQLGSAYTFASAGAAARTETAKLTASDGAMFDTLGFSVAIDGDTIVAGAPGDTVGTNFEQGSVYTFARAGAAARTDAAKLTATDGAAQDLLGISVAIDGDSIIAGAFGNDVGANIDQGSAYTFARAGAAARTQTGKLDAADGAAGDELGTSVAIAGDTILAGAHLDDVGANTDQGSASVFFAPGPTPPPPPPPPTSPPAPTKPPVLSKLKVSPSTFRRGTSVPRIAKSRTGTRITFALTSAAKVRLSFAKAEPGRTVGRACRRPSRSNRNRRRCTRYVTVGSFTVRGRRGSNTVAFAGRLSRTKRLSLGSYKLTATPIDSARKTGRPNTARLKIVAH